jgi:hypothetical protein
VASQATLNTTFRAVPSSLPHPPVAPSPDAPDAYARVEYAPTRSKARAERPAYDASERRTKPQPVVNKSAKKDETDKTHLPVPTSPNAGPSTSASPLSAPSPPIPSCDGVRYSKIMVFNVYADMEEVPPIKPRAKLVPINETSICVPGDNRQLCPIGCNDLVARTAGDLWLHMQDLHQEHVSTLGKDLACSVSLCYPKAQSIDGLVEWLLRHMPNGHETRPSCRNCGTTFGVKGSGAVHIRSGCCAGEEKTAHARQRAEKLNELECRGCVKKGCAP